MLRKKMKINYDGLLDLSNVKIPGDTSEVDEIIEYAEILFEISKSIINYRKENNLTQKEMADKLNIKQSMIVKLERGNYNPTFKSLHKISRSLTNSATLFIDTLQNIISRITYMHQVSYNITIENKTYVEKEESKNIYINEYNVNYVEGGYYGTEKGTSSIAIAG